MLELFFMKFLLKKIPPKYFFLSQIILLTLALIFLFGIHYIVNIQYAPNNKPFSLGPVTSKPKSFTLDLDQPAQDSLVFNKEILLSGKTGPNMEVLISSNSTNQVIKSKTNGTFSLTLELEEGINQIKVVVFDTTGDFREEERTVYHSKEKI